MSPNSSHFVDSVFPYHFRGSQKCVRCENFGGDGDWELGCLWSTQDPQVQTVKLDFLGGITEA